MSLHLPGQLLNLEYSKTQYSVGQGCYQLNGKIFASVCGRVSVGKDNVVSVESTSKEGNRAAALQIGSIVIAKVLRIRENKVEVKILLVEDVQISYNLQGIIRKQDVRQTNLDIMNIEEEFIPGDIIKAKFISYGDSQKLYLSVCEEELGVIFAKHSESNDD